jgi:hypothetical protein
MPISDDVTAPDAVATFKEVLEEGYGAVKLEYIGAVLKVFDSDEGMGLLFDVTVPVADEVLVVDPVGSYVELYEVE